MNYTHMSVAGRNRVVATRPDGARFVTTATDLRSAAAIAGALNAATENLAHYLVPDLMTWSGGHATYPEAHAVESPFTGWGAEKWSQVPAPADALDTTRRALAYLDNPKGRHTFVPHGYVRHLDDLARALADQPDSVDRAVRDELTAWLAPYDQVPVFAVVYDCKWDDVRQMCVLNAGLADADNDTLDRYADPTTAHELEALLDKMENAGYGDFRYSLDVAEAGYLRVAVNQSQLAGWIARHRS